jgi:hypothetical protein
MTTCYKSTNFSQNLVFFLFNSLYIIHNNKLKIYEATRSINFTCCKANREFYLRGEGTMCFQAKISNDNLL